MSHVMMPSSSVTASVRRRPIGVSAPRAWRAVALAASGKLKGVPLVTHRFPLEAITEGLRVLRERIGEPLKVVFIP